MGKINLLLAVLVFMSCATLLFGCDEGLDSLLDEPEMHVGALNSGENEKNELALEWISESAEKNARGATVASIARSDTSKLGVRAWPSGHITGRFDPGNRNEAVESVYFEVQIGPDVPEDWKNSSGDMSPRRFIDVRFIDKDGRTFAVRDGGPTPHKELWQDALGLGLVSTEDLEADYTDIAPRKIAGIDQVKALEENRIKSGTLAAPVRSLKQLVISDMPKINGVPDDAVRAIWGLGRAVAKGLDEQPSPNSLEEQNRINQEEGIMPRYLWGPYTHKATIWEVEVCYDGVCTGVWHSSLERSRGIWGATGWLSAFTGYTCNHGPCADDIKNAWLSNPNQIGTPRQECGSSWAGRWGEVKGLDWDCQLAFQQGCSADEPTPGQCGHSDYGFNTGQHVCNDDTWLQYKDIKFDTYHDPTTIARCHDNIAAYHNWGCP